MKKSKIFHLTAYILTAIGGIGIFAVDKLFSIRVKAYISKAGEVPMAKENFSLFMNLTLGLCALLMALQFLMLAVDALSGNKKKSFTKLVGIIYAPLSMAVVLAIAVFFAYLSADRLFPVAGYIIALGVCEAALFCLPMAIRSLLEEKRSAISAEPDEK